MVGTRPVVSTCGWCGRTLVDGTWERDRKREQAAPAVSKVSTVCPDCALQLTLESHVW
jgi:hypothetical protein